MTDSGASKKSRPDQFGRTDIPKGENNMTPDQYYAVVSAIPNYTDRDAFVTDFSRSSIFGEDANPSHAGSGRALKKYVG